MKVFKPLTASVTILLLAACVGGGGSGGSGSAFASLPPHVPPIPNAPITQISTSTLRSQTSEQTASYTATLENIASASGDFYLMFATGVYVDGHSDITRIRCPSGSGLSATCAYEFVNGNREFVSLQSEPTVRISDSRLKYLNLSRSAWNALNFNQKLARLGVTNWSNLGFTSTSTDSGHMREGSDIALITSTGTNPNGDAEKRFGAWMEESGFYLQMVTPDGESSAFRAFAAGDRSFMATLSESFTDGRSNHNPREAAVYRGMMVGTSITDITGVDAGDRLAGDALLVYRIDRKPWPPGASTSTDDPRIDVTFSNIRNLDTASDLEGVVISFDDVFVSKSGRGFNQGAYVEPTPGDYIAGNFYGSGTESLNEVAGAFKQDSYIGAFGAKMQ